MEELATTYSAESVPPLARYLKHDDAAVRAAAIDALLRLGDASASPLLRAAAKASEDPDEIVAMLNAAKYLELPSRPPGLRARRQKQPAPDAPPPPDAPPAAGGS